MTCRAEYLGGWLGSAAWLCPGDGDVPACKWPLCHPIESLDGGTCVSSAAPLIPGGSGGPQGLKLGRQGHQGLGRSSGVETGSSHTWEQ